MLAPLRRCPASLPRALSAAAATRFALRNSSIASPRALVSSNFAPLLSVRAFQSSVRLAEAQAVATATTDSNSASPITRFEELAERNIVHRNVIDTIVKDMGLVTMTDVQTATINQALQGSDIIAQAKTGTGKTLGFLLPMLQNILSKTPALAERAPRQFGRRAPVLRPDIRAIIVSPTRELAEQIAVEARRLTARTSVKIQTAVGGTGKREGMRRIMTEGCHVLVATPGRLNDILGDAYSPIPVDNLDYFIYDEADRLLETGFSQEIHDIQEKLPDASVRDRQTLMFSATVPQAVVRLVRQTLRPGFHFVKTVRDDEEPTHARIPQKYVITTGFETQLPALLEICQREANLAKNGEKRPFKAIIYFNSLKETQIAFSIFNRIRRVQKNAHALWEGQLLYIHSELTQGARQRQADTFRAADKAVLFSTDVTARGMDFPNVTHVIQLGIPRDPADYVHRIGRTGRAGKEGEGWLIIPEVHRNEVRYKLGNLPLKKDTSLATAEADLDALEEVPEHAQQIIKTMQDSFTAMDEAELEDAFPRILASQGHTRDKRRLVESMKFMAKKLWGLEKEPHIPGSTSRGIGLGGPRGKSSGGPRGQSSRSSRPDHGEFNLAGPRVSRWGGNGRPPPRAVGVGNFGDDRASGPSRFDSDRSSGPSRFGGDRSSGPSRFGGDRSSGPGRFGGDRSSGPGRFGGDRSSGPGRYSSDRSKEYQPRSNRWEGRGETGKRY
ncbi:atp-dependent rna helicase mss116 [Diplodia corticola]|uniref:ATP-dependent RNA helicase n=1 Tax=Diplodia corticola TaxID=236234 RepID=A0A1J9QMV0_9PEZI|nr:atp-dependent rna helicase mss116 [Diplodia corticola]OJD29800.1 atp-dependent rna helicase mss116 [Diplodia corticola]